MHVIAVGVDSETKHGKPITFQFYSKELELEHIVWIKKPSHATRQFLEFCESLPATRDRHYVFFGHNLAFDMISFFYDRHHRLREENIKETWYGWKIDIVYAAVRFATFKKKHRSITLIDTGAYFSSPPRKLSELAEIFCPNLPKLAAPDGLGNKSFSARDRKFILYAMRDSEIAYYVGLFLLARHREWDISLSVSGPHFASKVFRRHFLKKTIPLPPRKIIYAAMASYHGGKNNLTVQPGYYKHTYSLDIKSAYPAAMASFPSFSNPDLYAACKGTCTPRSVPPFGIYKVSGTAKACKWPSIYTHNFKPVQGDFSGIWTTGFELNEALRCKEITLTETFGYFYDADRDTEASPFRAFVQTFFDLKEEAKEKPQREFNKLLMNALYGKFIQSRHLANSLVDIVYDLDEKKLIEDSSIMAGGLFNPFIATLITGHCRASIHRLEHQYKALHTSTDGIKLQGKKPKQVKGLGGLSIESGWPERTDTLILRNKLYIDYSKITAKDRKAIRSAKRRKLPCPIKLSKVFKGKKIVKYALHGFHQDVFTLEKMWQTGTRDYQYVKVNKLRESLRRNLQVNDFVTTNATLKIPAAVR